MKTFLNYITAAIFLTVVLAAATVSAAETAKSADFAALQQSFQQPPDDCRPMMRWWWFGPAVTKTELERELRFMKEGGIGGFEVQPVYPLALDDAAKGIRNLPYLSKDFLDALRFTSEKARELGLRMDLTLGSGWPYGGAPVPLNQAATRLRWERVPVKDGTRRVPAPNLTSSESFIAAYAGGTRELLTDIKDGVLWLPENGRRPEEVWFFIAGRTGQQVKRAAVGAEGFVLDHYNHTAVFNYLNRVGAPMLDALGTHPPYAIFCDSLEVYGGDWTDDFVDRVSSPARLRSPPLAAPAGCRLGAGNRRVAA